jgi:hypothetical protein
LNLSLKINFLVEIVTQKRKIQPPKYRKIMKVVALMTDTITEIEMVETEVIPLVIHKDEIEQALEIEIQLTIIKANNEVTEVELQTIGIEVEVKTLEITHPVRRKGRAIETVHLVQITVALEVQSNNVVDNENMLVKI